MYWMMNVCSRRVLLFLLLLWTGQNPLFDIFPCQVHFFTETEPGKFFGKLNWRVEEPDGEFFTKDALQEFVQDPKDPAHMINHDNEYLHYKDDWYIIDYDDGSVDPANKFVFVYYRGSNDAWDGYGGAFIYTTSPTLPEAIRPRLLKAAAAIHYDFDKDFTVTDNSCPADQSAGEKVVLREKFIADKVLLQTESQLQSASVRLRGSAVNSIKAQKLFFENRFPAAQKAFDTLDQSQQDFEREYSK
jgi:violaxanthin de-epoxidase